MRRLAAPLDSFMDLLRLQHELQVGLALIHFKAQRIVTHAPRLHSAVPHKSILAFRGPTRNPDVTKK
jgi:hypothetical protein